MAVFNTPDPNTITGTNERLDRLSIYINNSNGSSSNTVSLTNPSGLEWTDPGDGTPLQLKIKVSDSLGFDAISKVLTTNGTTSGGEIIVVDNVGIQHCFIFSRGETRGKLLPS